MADGAVTTQLATRTRTVPERRAKQPRLWNVVLLDDDEHTYEYVIEMVQAVFGRSREHAFLIARKVDTEGRAVCLTTHLELAELKVEQVRSHGADPRISTCKGCMSVILEPAETGDDEPEDSRR